MRRKKEQGSIIIESTYCVLLCILVFLFLISFGFLLYQRNMVTVAANEAAQLAGYTYKLQDVTDRSSVTEEQITDVGVYRYWFASEDGAYRTKSVEKAKSFASVRLSTASLADNAGGFAVTIKKVDDDIGRKHLEVTVKQKYRFFMSDMLALVGIKDPHELSKTVYVECLDISYYINSVKATKYALDELSEISSVIGLVNSVISLISSVLGWF